MADYRVQLPSADPIMVRANNRAQAIRYATHKLVKIEPLTTEEAIRLAKAGQELHDATAEPEQEQEQSQEGNGSNDPAGSDATTQDAAKSDASDQSGTNGAGDDNGDDKAVIKPTNRVRKPKEGDEE